MPAGSSSPRAHGWSGFPLFFLTFTLNNTPLMLVCFALRGDVPDRPAGAAQRRPRRRAAPAPARSRHVARHRPAEQCQRGGAGASSASSSDVYGLRTAFLIVLPLMGLSGLILLLGHRRPTSARSAALRREIRAEALGADDVPTIDRRRCRRRSDDDDRREGETFGQAAIRLARTGPTVEEGGDLLVDRGPRRVVRSDPGPVRGVDADPGRRRARPRRPQRRRQDDAAELRSPGWSSGARVGSSTTGSTSPACPPNSGSSSGSH